MTPPVSGGVPEQGLTDEILSFLDDVAERYNSDTGDRDGGRPGDLAKRLRAALERPRPALPTDNRGIVGALQDLQEAGSPKRDYKLFLASGEALYGSKGAVQEAHWAIWRAEPTTTCTGQTYRDFAERCDRARQEAEQRAADATKLANELAGAALPAQTGNPPPDVAAKKIAEWRALAARMREDLKHETFESYDRLDMKVRQLEACAEDLEAALRGNL